MSNYPDDIRQYDNDPRSPFYDDRYERYMDAFSHSIAIDPNIMIDVMADSENRYGNIVSILCDLYDKKSNKEDFSDQLNQLCHAWLELAEETAKRYEENKRIKR